MPRFLQHLRVRSANNDSNSRSRSRSRNRAEAGSISNGVWIPPGYSSKTGNLPLNVLAAIFYHVAPHTSDESYKSLEDSLGTTGEGCVLCENRDLAACMRVNRRWSIAGAQKLYRSIRLDAVHYCEREIYLSEKRKKKHGDDNQQEIRIKLLERSLRERQHLAQLVEFIKVPYMTREGFKPDLARIVSNTQNLKYIDLPEGLYSDHPSCMTLKMELQARCPDLRFMKYKAGSESTFALHVQGNLWYNLENLGLEELDLEPDVLAYALSTLANLRKLNMERMGVLKDELFAPNSMLPPLPAVRTLRLVSAPQLTAWGLLGYLRRPDVAATTVSLQLENTGVAPGDVHAILDATPNLTALVLRSTVAHALPATDLPPIAHRRLRTFHFEILPETTHTLGNAGAESYYNYLANSLTQATLPSLRALYVYYQPFPDLLIAPPTFAPLQADHIPPPPSPGHPPRHQAPQPLGMPPRLSAMPVSLAPTPGSPGLPPSMQNRMSSLTLSPPPGASAHVRTFSNSSFNQRPGSSHGMGYQQGGFAPSRAQYEQASAPVPAPPNLAASLGLRAPLRIYTKSPDAEEMEWLVTVIEPPRPGTRGGGAIRHARPMSLIGLESVPPKSMPGQHAGGSGSVGGSDDLAWLGDSPSPPGKKSGALTGRHGGQMVGNGFGGFIEVRDDGKKGRRKGKGADWMG